MPRTQLGNHTKSEQAKLRSLDGGDFNGWRTPETVEHSRFLSLAGFVPAVGVRLPIGD